MNCPDCGKSSLQPRMARRGIEVDVCRLCGGIWLDKGEVFYFARDPRAFHAAVNAALKQARLGARLGPVSGEPLAEFSLGGATNLGFCPQTKGLWVSRLDVEPLRAEGIDLGLDAMRPRPKVAAAAAAVAQAVPGLPNLALRSMMTLGGLYAVLGLVLVAVVEFSDIPVEYALVGGAVALALQFLLGPFILDLMLRWFHSLSWVQPHQLPYAVAEFTQRTCATEKMRFPRFGIIDDGTPNAFTYGHTPRNARLVVTRGLLELLDEEEVNAVVAHELGHIRSWDMLLMTLAQFVPLLLYYIYRALIEKPSGEDKAAHARLGAALVAFFLYIVTEYVVLWFSRTREYHADRYAASVTHPNHLARGLVKVGYGLASRGGEAEAGGPKKKRKATTESIGALGIFDAGAARALAVASTGPAGSADPEAVRAAMRWDLWNPWARWFEFGSTHPLVARRLEHLSALARARGDEPVYAFDERQPESYWDEFLVDLAVKLAPPATILGAVAAWVRLGDPMVLWGGLFAFGLVHMICTVRAYPGGAFPDLGVASLLRLVKVSGVRGVPCTVRGTIIGRGVPGLVWSEDMVLRDDSGLIFLDYRQPLRIWEFFFGLLRGRNIQNQEVEATGWYRRAPMPYVELRTLRVGGRTRRCWVYPMRLAFGVLVMVAGIAGPRLVQQLPF